jgi:hypothetical protein
MTITGQHVFNGAEMFSISELWLDMEVGVGATTGQGSNPQIMLKVSRDAGHTWSSELWKSIGAIGKYLTEVKWTRLGRGYSFTFEVTISDPVKRCIIGAWITAS